MTSFFIGLAVGVVVGVCLGALVMAALIAGTRPPPAIPPESAETEPVDGVQDSVVTTASGTQDNAGARRDNP